jgi:hypothetical protein
MAAGQRRGTNANAAIAACRAGVVPTCELTLVLLVLCDLGGRSPNVFRYCNSHSTMYRTSDVFAELRRYFCGNSVSGSKIAADFAAQTANALTQFDVSVSYLIRFEDQ